MSAVDEILADIPLTQLAGQLGVDESTAESAVRQAIPALLGGLQANAEDPDGAASLAGAISNHDSSLVEGGVNLDDIDTADGQKIVNHVFGGNTDQVISTLGNNAGGQGDLIQKLLPILAPIVLSYLSKQLSGGKYGDILGPLLQGAAQQMGSGAGAGAGAAAGGGLADLLGALLAGGSQAVPQATQQTQAAQAPSNPILDLLGGLLGGGRR